MQVRRLAKWIIYFGERNRVANAERPIAKKIDNAFWLDCNNTERPVPLTFPARNLALSALAGAVLHAMIAEDPDFGRHFWL